MGNNNPPDKQVENRDEQGRFVPGVSGNPTGRPPKGQALTDVMREIMEAKPEIKKALVTKLIEMAVKGDLPAIREVLDRTEGKALQRTDITTGGESIKSTLDELETDYGKFGREAQKQVVENDPPVQDKGQAGSDSTVSAE